MVVMVEQLEPRTLMAASPDVADKTSWAANWVWDNTDGVGQSWMRLRDTVNLSSVPSTLPTYISADSKYWLWVNGTAVVRDGNVKRGPTKSDGYYDTVDLAPYLHTGNNTIAAMVWFFGKTPGANSNVNSGKGAFILQADSGSTAVIKTDATWKASLASAFTSDSAGGTHLAERPFIYDARQDDGSWTGTGFDDSGWANATAKGIPPVAPWGSLWSGQIPVTKDYGLTNYVNQTLNSGVYTATLPYNMQVSPYLSLGSGTLAGQTILIKSTNPNDEMRVKYVTRAGAQTWEDPTWMSGEAITYTIPAGVVVQSLQYRQSGYDTTFAGSTGTSDFSSTFTSSDPALNTFAQKAARTLYVSLRDSYFDTPDRERGQWIGDMTNEIGASFYAFDKSIYPLIRKGVMNIDFFNGSNTGGSGPILSLSPNGANGFNLTNQWLPQLGLQGSAYLYYQFSGDMSVVNFSADFFYRVLMKQFTMKANGLPNTSAHDGDWWYDGNGFQKGQGRGDQTVYQTGLYYSALLATRQLCLTAGLTANVTNLDVRITSIQNNFNSTFWNGTNYVSPGYSGPADERGAALAVITGLADSSKFPQLRAILTTTFLASQLSENWVDQALFMMGYPTEALNRMKSQYAAMINSPISTLWENFPNNFPNQGWNTSQDSSKWDKTNGTFNHGWAAGNLQMLGRYAAGIYPTTPGCATMQVMPQLGSLTSLNTTVSTPKGNISVAYAQTASTFSATLTEPAGMTSVQLSLPTVGSNPHGNVTVNGVTIVKDGVVQTSVTGVTYVGVSNGNYVFTVLPGTWNFSVVTGQTAPAASTGLTATPSSTTQINLAWTDNSNNEMTFKIERSPTGLPGSYTQVGTVGANVTSYSDTGLTDSTPYYYRVRAGNLGGDSAFSNSASATTQPVVIPIAPTGLTAIGVLPSQINLSWNAVGNATSYNIYRGTSVGTEGTTPINSSPISTTTYSDLGLNTSSTYYYTVKAVNKAGTSPASSEANGTTQAATTVLYRENFTGNDMDAPGTVGWHVVGQGTNVTERGPNSSGGDGTVGKARILAGSTPASTASGLPSLNSGVTDTGTNRGALNLQTNGTRTNFGVVAYTTEYSIDLGTYSVSNFAFNAGCNFGSNPAANAKLYLLVQQDGLWYVSNSYQAPAGTTDGGGVGAPSVLTFIYNPSTFNRLNFTGPNGSSQYALGAIGAAATLNAHPLTGFGVYAAVNPDLSNKGSYINIDTFTANITGTITPPAAPTGVAATATSSSQINLTWNAISGATGYNLYRGTSAGGEGATAINGATPITGTSYSDTGLAASTSYYYFVKAVNTSGASPASNETNAVTATKVNAVQINDGNAQRSMIKNITYSFSGPVALGIGAFTLTRRSDGLVVSVTTTPAASGSTYASSYVLSFSGSSIVGGSLDDGVYDLVLNPSRVQDASGQSVAGGDQTYSFIRLYGDYDGNGTVNNTDFGWFKRTFNQSPASTNYLWFMDFDGNGAVNNTDFGWFKRKFGKTLSL